MTPLELLAMRVDEYLALLNRTTVSVSSDEFKTAKARVITAACLVVNASRSPEEA